jgi:protoporphyrinogen oxidase
MDINMRSRDERKGYKNSAEIRFFSLQRPTQTKMQELSSDVIAVIGGGIAGLFAARELLKSGHTVVIIEAQDRLGGRVYPVKVPTKDGTVELQLGANFMHNTGTETPNMLISELDPQFDFTTPETSLHKLGKPVLLESGEVCIVTEDGRSFKKAYGEMEYGCALDKISQYDRSKDFGLYAGYENFFLYDGFTAMLERLQDELNAHEQCTIFTGTRVESVKYLEMDRKHVIGTNLGSITCQQIVCALPIGVLQQGAVQFTPKLPDAIDAVNSGSAARIVIQFEGSLINPKYSHIALHDKETNTILRILNVDHYRQSQTPSNCLVVTYVPLPGNEEKLTPELVLEKVKIGLKNQYLDKARMIEEGALIVEQNWSQDPYCMGGWSSFNRMTSNDTDVNNWFSEMEEYGEKSGVYFAGEHMSKGENGTVHGAALSGIDAAHKLEKDLQAQKTSSLYNG